ncbi:MAG: glycosyltransferase family 1 protein [Methanomassiliicoccales archaeon]
MGARARTLSFVLESRYRSAKFPGARIEGLYPLASVEKENTGKTGILFNRLFFRSIFSKHIRFSSNTVVHFTNQEIPPFETEAKSVVTIHDLFSVEGPSGGGIARSFYDKLIASYLRVYKRFENVIAVSDRIRKQLLELGFEGNITVIHSAVSPSFRTLRDKDGARLKLGLPQDATLVLSVSTMHRRKNLDTVRRAVELLGDSYRLVRVGGSVGNSINFDVVDDETLNLLYNACDVLLFPSYDEGFGYPMVEAFAAGLPVVASDIEIMREISQGAALLVTPEPRACAAAVKEAIERREELANNGLQRAKHFSMESFGGRMSSFYDSL